MNSVIFKSGRISIACVSDTCNENDTTYIPEADMFLHAGDLTEEGTFEELEAAYEWIATLPHKVKVIVAGDHDLGLDASHPGFSVEAHSLFTSSAAQAAGIHYLDREVRQVAQFRCCDGSIKSIRVYGNPYQSDFCLKLDGAFNYPPFPYPGAADAWRSAPIGLDQPSADIWLTHQPPKGHLDHTPPLWLTGCQILSQCIARARPLLSVFGHYPSGYGIEKVTWDLMEDKANLSEVPSERCKKSQLNLSAPEMLDKDLNTLFVNASWMTSEHRKTDKRNLPWLIKLNFDLDQM